MPFVEINGARVFFTDDGDGDPVLLLHGLGCDSHDWNKQIRPLARHHRVIVPDLVGHGRSDARETGYGLLDLARDAAALLEVLACENVVVIGHSLGGVIASALAVERPDLVRSVVGIDAGIELPVPNMTVARSNANRVLGPEGSAAFAQYTDVPVDGEPEWYRTWRVRRLIGTAPHVVAGCYMALKDDPGGTPWIEYLGRRQCPVLALHRNTGLADIERDTLRHPLSRCSIWKGGGHWFHQQDAKAVNEMLLSWIRQTDPTRRTGDVK